MDSTYVHNCVVQCPRSIICFTAKAGWRLVEQVEAFFVLNKQLHISSIYHLTAAIKFQVTCIESAINTIALKEMVQQNNQVSFLTMCLPHVQNQASISTISECTCIIYCMHIPRFSPLCPIPGLSIPGSASTQLSQHRLYSCVTAVKTKM